MAIWQFNTWFQAWRPSNTWFNAWFSTWTITPRVNKDEEDTYTFNSRYPWFDEEDYRKLEKMVADKWITGSKKTDIMDQLYQKLYPTVMNKHKLNERQVEINQATYKNWGEILNGNKEVKMWECFTTLAQEAKKKYNIPYNVDDQKLVDDIVNWTENWNRLLYEYVTNWNPEIFYAAKIWDRPQQEGTTQWWVKNLINEASENNKSWDRQAPEEVDEWKSAIWQFATDVVWWAYDSATGLPRFIAKWAADVIGWTAKQLWADEDKVNSLVQSYKDSLKDFSWEAIGADTDSITYNVTKWVWDIAQVVWWEALLKWAVQGTAKWAELMNYLKDAPTWQKIVAGWLEWAWDMTLYSIVSDSELPTAWEVGIGTAIWAAIPWASAAYKAVKPAIKKWLQKTAAKLELSWLLNPAKLNTIKNQLITEWTDLAKAWLKGWEADDVGKWMIERWFKWDKPTIIKDLGNYAKKSHKLKREILGVSKSLHTVESANKSLEVIHNTIKDVPWLEKRLSRVEKLMGKKKYTLSELDEIKSILDDTKNLYTVVWNPKEWAINEWLINVRKDLRKYIEDAATKEWLGNVKMLNNETQISKALEDAISRKDSADAAREILSVFDKWTVGWGILGGTVWWPFDNDSFWWKLGNIILWAVAWKYLFSTQAKTNIASALNSMSWWAKKELSRLVGWEITSKALSSSTKKSLSKALEKAWMSNIPTPSEFTTEEISSIFKNLWASNIINPISASITTSVMEEEE